MIVLFPRYGGKSSSTSAQPCFSKPKTYQTSLGSKLQRLALEQPKKLRLLEEVVDRWLAHEGEAS